MIMAPALRTLLWLRLRAGVRARLREALSIRGVSLLGLTFIVLWVLAGAPSADEIKNISMRIGDPAAMRAQLVEYLPVGLLVVSLITAFTAVGSPIHFSPAETNFLFSGPFDRRSLLLYKFSTFAFGSLISAALVVLVFSVANPFASFAGAFLILLFTQLFSVAISMLIALSRRSSFARWHKVFSAFLILLCIAALTTYIVTGREGVGLVWEHIRETAAMQLLLAPFIPFMRVFVASNAFVEVIGWTLLAVSIIAVLLYVVIRLDELTYDAMIAAEEGITPVDDRKRSKSIFRAAAIETASPNKVFFRLGGVGTLIWRQWTIASRNSSRTLIFLVFLMAFVGVAVSNLGAFSPQARITILVVVGVFLLPRSMVYDFRSDLGVIERLKLVPVAPWRICLGQILVPVILTTVLEWVLIATALPSLEPNPQKIALLFGLYLIPLNFIIYGIENLMVLLFPISQVPVGRMDFNFIGRTLVDLGVKVAAIVTFSAVAGSVGLVVSVMTDRTFKTAIIPSWLLLCLFGALLVPCMAWAFRRFDVQFRSLE